MQRASEGLVGAGGVTLMRPELRSSQPVRVAVIIKEAVGRALERRSGGGRRATIIGAQPNKRLKMTAIGVYDRITNVHISLRCHSFGAYRLAALVIGGR